MATMAAPGSTRRPRPIRASPAPRHASRPKRPGRGSDAAPDVPVGIFRLAGIYGPGRNPLVKLAEGTAHRIVKPGQVFNRIHVADIAATLAAAIARPAARVYNVCDDEPAPPQDVDRLCRRA